MARRGTGLALLLALAGCARPGSAGPARALAYAVPTPATVDYVSGDTARIQIAAGGQRIGVNANVRESWRMAFAPAARGVQVTATLTDLDARLTNSMTAPQTADEAAVRGPVVFTLDPRGRATVENVPTIEPAVAQFLNGYGIAQGFFPRLPGTVVRPGQSWTDTVAYTTDERGAQTTVRSVTTYTAVGDSVDGHATYLLIRTAGTTEQRGSGTIARTKFSQSAAGTTSGHVLWDGRAGVLHELVYRSELTGTMDVALSPLPLAVTVTSTIRERRVLP